MRLSINNMQSRARDLEELISIKESSISNAPEGKIRISSGKGKSYYYYSENNAKGTRGKYLKKGYRDIAVPIAQRDYDERVVRSAKDELKTLNILIKKYERGTCEDIYEKLSLPRRELITPFRIPDEEYAKEWLAKPYEGLGFDEGAPEYYSGNGLRVRSKNEIMTANRIDEWHVPYKFECPLRLKGHGIVYPDFTLLNVRTRIVYYLEIMGKMTETEYAEDNIKKMQAYHRNGIVQGKNLILLFDTRQHPLIPKDIDIIVKNFLL